MTVVVVVVVNALNLDPLFLIEVHRLQVGADIEFFKKLQSLLTDRGFLSVVL